MTKDEALIVALETLKQIQEGCNNVIAEKLHSDAVDLAKLVRKDCNKAIDAIRKSLAQPEQKPVAWMREDEDCSDCIVWEQTEEHTIPLYTTPPKRKPLTDEQLIAAYESEQQGRYGDHIRSLRAIEAAHGIKGE